MRLLTMQMRKKNSRGFTMLEVMISLLVLSIGILIDLTLYLKYIINCKNKLFDMIFGSIKFSFFYKNQDPGSLIVSDKISTP